jgi:hypothetical protein
MVAYRAPQAVADTRRRKIRKEAQKKSRKIGETYLALQDFSIYITNVPCEVWSYEIIGTIYRIRWQIELVFKQWKQLFRINVMKGSRAERIRCLVYGRLIMILMVNAIYGFCAQFAHSRMDREVSMVKLTQWLKRKERLAKALQTESIVELLDRVVVMIPKLLLKQKRHRKTTEELLKEQIPFLNSFPNNRQDDGVR